jgi:hypothetical protein
MSAAHALDIRDEIIRRQQLKKLRKHVFYYIPVSILSSFSCSWSPFVLLDPNHQLHRFNCKDSDKRTVICKSNTYTAQWHHMHQVLPIVYHWDHTKMAPHMFCFNNAVSKCDCLQMYPSVWVANRFFHDEWNVHGLGVLLFFVSLWTCCGQPGLRAALWYDIWCEIATGHADCSGWLI